MLRTFERMCCFKLLFFIGLLHWSLAYKSPGSSYSSSLDSSYAPSHSSKYASKHGYSASLNYAPKYTASASYSPVSNYGSESAASLAYGSGAKYAASVSYKPVSNYGSSSGYSSGSNYGYSSASSDYCSLGNSPVCGTNGHENFLLENECELNKFNTLQVSKGQLILSKTTLNECYTTSSYSSSSYSSSYDSADYCPEYCNSALIPVCASFQNTQKNFTNECELQKYKCKTKENWQLILNGTCVDASCPLDGQQVCATYYGYNTTFPNMLSLYDDIRQTGKNWRILNQGPCPCPEIYRPICAQLNCTYQTFQNECFLNREIQNGTLWTIILKGECPEIPVNGTINGTIIVDPFNNTTPYNQTRKPVYIIRKNQISSGYPLPASSGYSLPALPGYSLPASSGYPLPASSYSSTFYSSSNYPAGQSVSSYLPPKTYSSSSTYVSDGNTYVKKSETVYGTGYKKPVVTSTYTSNPQLNYGGGYDGAHAGSSASNGNTYVKKSGQVYGTGYKKPVVTSTYNSVPQLNYGSDAGSSYMESYLGSFT